MSNRRVLRLRAGALAAVLAAAIAVFVGLAILVSVDPRPAADVAILGAARALAEPELVALAEGPLDTMAEPGVVVAAAVAAAIVLVLRRWWLPLAVLVVGLALTGWYGTELKYAFERVRPAYNLDEASNPAFPSGHARFSFFWTWLALTIATKVRLRASARRSLIGVGLALTGAAGLARVYIGAHWLTDVIAGWALSAGLFGAVTLLALGFGEWHGRRRAPPAGRTALARDADPGRSSDGHG